MATWLTLTPAVLLAAETAQAPPAELLKVEGPAVVFVAPAGPEGDELRQQVERMRALLRKRRIKAVETTPTLIHFGEEHNPTKRVRVMDFRPTPQFVGTVLFTESHDAQVRQGLEVDDQLLKRLEGYLEAARKGKAAPPP